MNGFEEAARDGEADKVALVARVRAGDREALGQLYQQCRPVVTRYLARRMNTCPADVEDVVQETFIRLPTMAQTFNPATLEVGGWLCGWVARATLIDHFRERGRHHRAIDGATAAARQGPAESVHERESRPLSARMVTALARLTAVQRRSMQLRYLEQLTVEHAATVAGCSQGTITRNYQHARDRLRVELADLAPRRSWLDTLSKIDAVRAAFEAIGSTDVPAARAWLSERGITVGHQYCYTIRNAQRGPAPVATVTTAPDSADRSGATRVEDTANGDRPLAVAAQAPPTLPRHDRPVADPSPSPGAEIPAQVRNSAEDSQSWKWVRAAQSGDREAFGRLYARYQPQIQSQLTARVGDRVLAEDLTSETFVRALNRIDTVSQQRSDPMPWLSTIARNLALDHAKSARTRLDESTSEVPEPRFRSGPGGQDSAETQALARLDRAEAVEAIQRGLTHLTPTQRVAVQGYLADRPVADTAVEAGCTPQAVRAARSRAMQVMRTALEHEGVTTSRHVVADVPTQTSRRERNQAEDTGHHAPNRRAGPVDAGEDVVRAKRDVAVGVARRAVDRASERQAGHDSGADESARAGQLALWHTENQTTQAEDTTTTTGSEDWAGESYGREDGAE